MSIDKIEIPLTVEETICQLTVGEVIKIWGSKGTWQTKSCAVKRLNPSMRFKIFEKGGEWYIGRKS